MSSSCQDVFALPKKKRKRKKKERKEKEKERKKNERETSKPFHLLAHRCASAARWKRSPESLVG
jgi:hypothetical protein